MPSLGVTTSFELVAQADQPALAMVIGPLGGFFEFAICRINVLFGFCRVAAELILILFLRFVDLSIGLLEMVLSVRKIGMPMPIDINNWTLGKGVASQNQTSRQQATQHKILDLHDSHPPYDLAVHCMP
jgi:hypothetical protein